MDLAAVEENVRDLAPHLHKFDFWLHHWRFSAERSHAPSSEPETAALS